MKDFVFWTHILAIQQLLRHLQRFFKTGNCHLPGLFGDLKKTTLGKWNQSLTTFGKEQHCICWGIDCTPFSRVQAQGELTQKCPGASNRRNTQENNCAPMGSWALIQVIWSPFACFWRQAEEQQWPKITQVCLILPVLGDCLILKLLHANYFRLLLTENRVLEIRCLQSHVLKCHREAAQENYIEQHQGFRNLGQSVGEVVTKLRKLESPKPPVTLWTLIPWHLCIPGYLTRSSLPLSLMKLSLYHWKTPLYLQVLWMDPLHCGHVSQPRMVLFTLSPMKRVVLKLDSVNSSYWILALISGGYFFLSYLILTSHCYFIIFLLPSKSPGPL